MTKFIVAIIIAATAFGTNAQINPMHKSDTGKISTTVSTVPSLTPFTDWANLDRYREQNATVASTEKPVQVVFMGDSIMDVWEEKAGSFFSGKAYVNRGISGQTTPQMLLRFQQDVVHLHPEVVVILAGTNDIAENTGVETPEMIEDNFRSMAAIARNAGIQVVIASVLPVYQYPWSPSIQPVEQIKELNIWLKDFCHREGFTYLDYYSALVDTRGGMRKGMSSDGVHPTALGYSIMAPLTVQAINEALAKKR